MASAALPPSAKMSIAWAGWLCTPQIGKRFFMSDRIQNFGLGSASEFDMKPQGRSERSGKKGAVILIKMSSREFGKAEHKRGFLWICGWTASVR